MLWTAGLAALASGSLSQPLTAQEIPLDRTELPIRQPVYPPVTELDARKVKPPPFFQIKAPPSAPNVLIVLIDDMGFGQSSAFGGPVRMPTLDALANEGLRFNEFHTTALCSPTRVALLTGRNHHINNMGSITETATAFQGNTGVRPNSVAPLAEILRLNGYATGAFGKSHETPVWELSASGPTDRWPTRSGFDKFYGFIGGETDQWAPTIWDGMTKIQIDEKPGYHFMTDMTNQAIAWVQSEKALTPDKPFFMYFAPGATHAPHHVPKEWIAKYKGQFDMGWDKLREQTLERQKKLGVVPSDAKLAPKPEAIKNWDALTADEKRLFARQMEVFAGFGEYADTEIGRLIATLKDLGQLDNTLIFFIVGDNGASAEGGMNGLFNEMTYFNGVPEPIEEQVKHIDDLGGPLGHNHYAAGWAVAGDTPFTWTKQVASSYGGTRNGMVVHWPKGVQAKNEIRSQWHHVIDVAPTILEAAGLPEPRVVNGTPQTPIQGVSMLPAFDDAKAPENHLTQYFEMFGNRGVYSEGWLAGTVHRAPWETKVRAALGDDKWELYDTKSDFSLTNDLALANPGKLREMQKIFTQEAIANHVLPIDDRLFERANPEVAGRPDLMAGRNSLTVYGDMFAIPENAFINVKNASFTITANVIVPKETANGVLVAQGGRFGGWSLYIKDGDPVYHYNFLGQKSFTVRSGKRLAPGKATIAFDFAYDGGGPGKGGTGTLSVNGEKVAAGRIAVTQCCGFSATVGADVGMNTGTPVSPEYSNPFKFNGKIEKITIDLKNDKASSADQNAIEQEQSESKLKRAVAN
ncbi:arylsulfatase [Methylocapsa palsarum]|nr:arylsulfatase [Methylocapsa palsarum]